MVVRRHPEAGERRLDTLRWGLVPHFTNDLKNCARPINARVATVATSGMFRGALAPRRCLVPADAFYEWKAMSDGKQPYAIARTDGAPRRGRSMAQPRRCIIRHTPARSFGRLVSSRWI